MNEHFQYFRKRLFMQLVQFFPIENSNQSSDNMIAYFENIHNDLLNPENVPLHFFVAGEAMLPICDFRQPKTAQIKRI